MFQIILFSQRMGEGAKDGQSIMDAPIASTRHVHGCSRIDIASAFILVTMSISR